MRFNLPPVIKQIVIACVVLFIGTSLLQMRQVYDLNQVLSMHYPSAPFFKPWQIITHMFMHGSIAHLVFNMFGLITMGTVLENILGSKRFLMLFFYSGLGSIALHLMVQVYEVHHLTGLWLPTLQDLGLNIDGDKIYSTGQLIKTKAQLDAIAGMYFQTLMGASGAIYGVVVAFAYLFPNTELMFMFIPYPIKAKYLVPIIIGLDLFLGLSNFQGDPIAHYAHLGGAITGFLLVYYWKKRDRKHFW
jgi:rhomboid-like protein